LFKGDLWLKLAPAETVRIRGSVNHPSLNVNVLVTGPNLN